MPIAVLGHPQGATDGFHRPARARFAVGINVQDNQRNFAPINTFRIRVQHPQVRDEVFVIVRRKREIAGRNVDHVRIEGWFLPVCTR
jgi:hypothetical protein